MHSVHFVPLRPRRFLLFRPSTTKCQPQGQPHSRRCIHQVRPLPYDVNQGLGSFLSPAALRMIAIDYQQGLLTRLNEQVKGTRMEGQSVTDTVISAASHERDALAFNYASQALNNSFFLECLQPPPAPPATNEDHMVNLGIKLLGDIRTNFGSLAQLKSTFSAAAMGMMNSGWVWLVTDEKGNLEVVATFGAGTLLVRSRTHLRIAGHPILGESIDSTYKSHSVGQPKKRTPLSATRPGYPQPYPTPNPSEPSGYTSPASTSHHIYSNALLTPTDQAKQADKERNIPGDILTPLLCLSVYEHAWVGGGYGVWGKEEYLKQFWTVVDWNRVSISLDRAQQI